MSNVGLARQYIRDASGKQIGVILPIEEYHALLRLQKRPIRRDSVRSQASAGSLYGVLCHLGGSVASTAELDETRRELWATWDREDAS
jgi:hypothetical protein